MHAAIDSAIQSAEQYSGSLEASTNGLLSSTDGVSIVEVALRLHKSTQIMQEANARLQSKLESSRAEIASLQGDLDQVRRESFLDALTTVFNRKYFDQTLLRAVNDAEAGKGPLSLVMLDIDHFKNFNDTWGHQTGDQILRLVAQTIKARTREGDIVARFGGEEFAVILPNTDLQGAATVAENFRGTIYRKELLKRSTNEKLGSGLIDQSQKMTVAAMHMADMKVWAHRS